MVAACLSILLTSRKENVWVTLQLSSEIVREENESICDWHWSEVSMLIIAQYGANTRVYHRRR